jgi:parvulin-like peptidyl-prolyl isomerase
LPKRRQSKIPTPAWEKDHNVIGNRLGGRPAQFYALAGVIALVFVALGIVAYSVVSDELADRNRPGSTAVQVEDRKYSLDDFTTRVESFVQQNGGVGQITAQDYQQVLPLVQEQLVEEQVLVRFASEQGISATEDEILDEVASRMGINKEDPTFATRFQEELNRTDSSEAEYREVATSAVLRRKALEKFKSDVPANAEQVNYRVIVVSDQAEADDIRTQLEAGADFATIAREKSLDTATKELGGEAGWTARGVLDKAVEDHLFAQEANKVTTFPTQDNIYVYQVTEKSADRPLEDAQKTTLGETKYGDWFNEKRKALVIKDFDAGNTDNVIYIVKRVWPDA